MSHASGMAAAVRAATESETFDLGGQNPTTIANTIRSAFSDPLPLMEMVRITFVTGAGKLERQKYDEGAAKAVTSTLRDLGFEEDRGASCIRECAGSFKLQHDTGKNLKTVVVFPNIRDDNENGGIENGMAGLSTSDGGGATTTTSLLPEKSPEHMIAMSSNSVFQRMLSSKCPSWSQKKGCVAAIESLKSTLKKLDEKLMSGTPLEDPEQDFYDSVTLTSLEDKEAHAKKEMQSQAEDGSLTKVELDNLQAQVKERLETVEKEMKESQEKPKKLEKLRGVKDKLTQRKDMLSKKTAQSPHKLRNEVQIMKLHKEMRPLQDLEDSAKGRLLSIKETQTLARKQEIMDEIEELEQSSRGWFEDDDAFQIRIDACRAAASALRKKTGAKKSSGGGGTGAAAGRGTRAIPATAKWVTPGATKVGGAWGSGGRPGGTKKKTSQGAGGVFAAMMMDSDSD